MLNIGFVGIKVQCIYTMSMSSIIGFVGIKGQCMYTMSMSSIDLVGVKGRGVSSCSLDRDALGYGRQAHEVDCGGEEIHHLHQPVVAALRLRNQCVCVSLSVCLCACVCLCVAVRVCVCVCA